MPRRKVERCKRGHFMTPGARYKDGSCRECQVERARERREAGTAVQRSVHKKRMAEVAREVRERMDAERKARHQRLADRLAGNAAVQLYREERARRRRLDDDVLAELRSLMQKNVA